MPRFEFPLESVLRLRRFAEATARQDLAEALGERNRAEAELERTRGGIRQRMASLQTGLAALSAAEVVNAWHELDQLEQLALKQAQILAEWEEEVARRTAVYVAAQQDRKPLERLREEQQREHLYQKNWAEQIENDELAVIGHSRKGGSA